MGPRRTAARLASALLCGVLLSACALPGVREDVDTAEARSVLSTAVGLGVTGATEALCELSPADASTCPQSLVDYADRRPAEAPTVACAVAAPDRGPLRGGTVLVLEGTDALGEEFVTEFVVYDDGRAVGVLDAVWWSGLTIASYSDDTVAWRFDSTSTLCEDGALEVEPAS